ncbi:sulfotransferase [Spiribacter halobius]|uniref:Sulfotransferase n=1 Tax=Sediminicurvatus halobius TaxID=2182432 RepID=A0A2U2N133_9GAMM|nr:sulfotransferase [Spiribacter halobius]PWG62674.1 hypothetical protein DEM34_11015 [Spiribacter halobius]UEX77343.1 sulfotransferase [Spiribacter halobius]
MSTASSHIPQSPMAAAATDGPVLLFGMPRSGTTWVGKVFDSHPDVLYLHEPDSGRILRDLPLLPDADDPIQGEWLQGFAERLPACRLARVTGKLPQFPKRYRSPLAERARSLLIVSAKAAGKASGRDFPVPALMRASGRHGVRLAWKSIESLGRLGLAVRNIPGARGVHIIRHPCGYVDSVLRGEQSGRLAGGVATSADRGIFGQLAETPQARRYGLDLDSLMAMEPEERLAWRWALFNEKALDDTEGSSVCRLARYEDLCRAPHERFAELFAFAGLSWEAQTRSFIRESTRADDGAYFGVHRDAARAADAWRERLPADVQGRVQAAVRDTRAGALYGL